MSDDDRGSSSTMAQWTLQNTRVVGVFKRGGAIVEECPLLTINEGRNLSISGDIDDPDRKESLTYDFTFEAADEPPESAMSEWAAIVITGVDAEGNRLSIEGQGWLGYDEFGRPQGNFLKPPKVKVVTGDDRAASLKKAVAEQWKNNPIGLADAKTLQ